MKKRYDPPVVMTYPKRTMEKDDWYQGARFMEKGSNWVSEKACRLYSQKRIEMLKAKPPSILLRVVREAKYAGEAISKWNAEHPLVR